MRDRASLLRVLDEAPLAVQITDLGGQFVFSDVPERLVDRFKAEIGEPFLQLLHVSDAEHAFIDALPEEEPAPAAYLKLHADGVLAERVARTPLRHEQARYFMAAINASDEAVLGRTGVLYFVCPKGCHFCQYRGFREELLSVEQAAELMLAFQEAGADNVQWLSPSTYTPFLLHALLRAVEQGFRTPLVHKSEGEDSAHDLALLDGLIDVYLPDAKFANAAWASRIGLSAAYPERLARALAEMHRQVGGLTRQRGTRLVHRGVLVRHLLMPEGIDELDAVCRLLESIDPRMALHLMTLYQPLDRALGIPEIARATTQEEANAAVARASARALRLLLR